MMANWHHMCFTQTDLKDKRVETDPPGEISIHPPPTPGLAPDTVHPQISLADINEMGLIRVTQGEGMDHQSLDCVIWVFVSLMEIC